MPKVRFLIAAVAPCPARQVELRAGSLRKTEAEVQAMLAHYGLNGREMSLPIARCQLPVANCLLPIATPPPSRVSVPRTLTSR